MVVYSDLESWCRNNGREFLLDEWDYSKNYGCDPTSVRAKSNKKVWWKCSKGHEWEAVIANRTRTVSCDGCPFCSGHRVWPGYNDLASVYPQIAQEWNYYKNQNLTNRRGESISTPEKISIGSSQKVWWKCRKGHEWQAKVVARTGYKTGQGTNCPFCSIESHSSFAEQAVYFYVKKAFPDSRSRDADTISLELDIYIPSIKTAIEYDGAPFHSSQSKIVIDKRKNRICFESGIELVRIQEKKIDYDDCVILVRDDDYSDDSLSRVICELLHMLEVSNIDVDVERDKPYIYESYIKQEKHISLLDRYPTIANEWHPYKNGSLTPEQVTSKSRKEVWWVCSKYSDHEWVARVDHRTTMNSGCPICAGRKVLPGFNDLQTKYPEIAKQWDYDNNNKLLPSEVTPMSDREVWWICPEKHHHYVMTVGEKTNQQNSDYCPYCNGKKVLPGFNDLQTKYPSIAEEWHAIKNGNKQPSDVLPQSNQKVWWKCTLCKNEWRARISSRTTGNAGCPKCSIELRKLSSYKSVVNVDTGIVYKNATDAAQSVGVTPRTIYSCCRGRQKTAGGYRWRYVD